MEDIPEWYHLATACPTNSTSLASGGWLHAPTTSICHFVIAISAALCTILIIVKCSSISALWKRSFPLAITNVHWIFFFVLTAIQSGLHCAVYVEHPSTSKLLHVNFAAGTVLRSVQVFLVSLAFQHERVYRRLAVARDNKSFQDSNCFEKCHLVNWLSTLLVIIQVVLVTLLEAKFPYSALVWAIQGVLLAQRCLVLCLVLVILKRHGNEDSPGVGAQLAVLGAMVMTSPSDISIYTLNAYASDTCLIYFGTLYDLFLIMDFFGNILLLVYVRLEYVRLLPVCQYSLISSIQGRMNFHPH